MNIELSTSPLPEDENTISQGLVNFNHETIRDLEPAEAMIKFSIFLRDGDGKVLGGLRAICFWNTLHIELLWLSVEARGQGKGTAMVELAEQYAVENGFELALLESTSWQARSFYEKLGYNLMATLPDYPKGQSCHFMTKKLLPHTK
ncbi:GNAT family N-acetyltransferase [bacterium]|nr:GNAT family N-acetyltransferase [bacterium]